MLKIALIVVVLGLIAFFAYRTFFSSMSAEQLAQLEQAEASFMQKNAKEEGVNTTDSGLQYKVLQKGEGTVHPSPTSRVKVHYEGKLVNGTVFDSSYQRGEPIVFGLNQVIKGWTEGVQLMVEGEKTRFFIPAELAYGNRATGPIPAGSTLIFDIELLGVNVVE